MTKTIFIPQGNPTTTALRLSVAIELLSNRVDTMEVQFQENPESLSSDDWEDFIKCAEFLNAEGRKNYKTIDSVKDYLANYYYEQNLKQVIKHSYLR